MNTELHVEPFELPTRGRVLIAEDDDELADLLSAVLGAEGLTVDTVSTGTQLLSALDESDTVPKYDVVLSDLRMPGLTGLDVLALTTPGRRPPVILMTAFPRASVHKAARDFGVVAVLSKPFDLESVRALVDWVLVQRPVPDAVV